MMKMILYSAVSLLVSTMCYSQQTAAKRFEKDSKYFSAYVNDVPELVVIRKSDRKTLLRVNLADYDAAQYLGDTSYGQPYRLWDINVDGYEDLSFASNSGNVQRFEQVYLFDPVKKELVENAELGEIACIDVDPVTKTISGNCFHSSAAENWSETYQWHNGKLLLIGKEGTLPCPPDQDCYFTYRQKRVKGKMKFIYKTKHKI